MEKQPTYEIGNLNFLVDVECKVLRHPIHDEIVFHFEDMEDKGTHYLLRYDPDTMDQLHQGEQLENMVTIPVPQMVTLDPAGVALCYSIDSSELPQRDADLVCRQDLLEQRSGGKQPIIEICDHDFFIDLHWGLLRPKDDFSTLGIELGGLSEDPSGTLYQFWYDIKKHEVFWLNDDDLKKLTKLPEGILCIDIPLDHVLDPYGDLRKWGNLEGVEYFNKYPVRERLKARIRPWEKTMMLDLIAENKKRLEQKSKKRLGR